ncbi:MAG: phosphatidylglycerophosphatase A [Halioglobus sp.]
MTSADQPRPFSSPMQFFAFGFGSGLAPWAPGTAGTVLAVPLYFLVAGLSLPMYSVFILVTALLGIWFCDAASRELGVHDHPGIVWDEFVGYWITMWALPVTWEWALAGFVAFRIFDIAKPWPIGWLDKRVKGGFGIMVDDVLAGVIACGLLHLVRLFLVN